MKKRLLWEASLVVELFLKELRLQYRGAFLGLLWGLINPLLLMAVYTLLFAGVFKAGIPSYPIFVLAGLIPWTFFAAGLNGATHALVAHLPLLRAHRIPARVFPLAAALGSVAQLAVALVLFAACRALSGSAAATGLFWLGPVMALQLVLTLGLGLACSAANALFRDTHQALLFFLRVWFFLTPVVYSGQQLPGAARLLLWLNPMAGLVEAYRQVLLSGARPALAGLMPSICWGVLLVLAGLALERAVTPRLAEA